MTALPEARGKLLLDEPLGPFTWFRVGGNADALFIPADADELADFLKALDPAVPVTVRLFAALSTAGALAGLMVNAGNCDSDP